MANEFDPASLTDDTQLRDTEVEKVFRIDAGSLRNRRWRGLPPVYRRYGRSVRYSVGDIRRFIAESAVTPASIQQPE
jgi:hypothetical protein